MLSKNRVKFIQSLDQKKFRQQSGLFVVEGFKAVEELLRSPVGVDEVYTSDPAFLDVYPSALLVHEKELAAASFQKSPQGVLALARIRPQAFTATELESGTTLLLDAIGDPGNLGTMLRVALWFGIDRVGLLPGCVDPWSPKVVQSAMGALFHMPFGHVDAGALEALPLPVLGMFLEGESIYSADLPGHGVYVIGSEANGISPAVAAFCTGRITIPGSGRMESLNAGIAAGVLCGELFRRKTAG
jgi:TrmH family RNA methyltransferase